jgi:hypothetical protein
MPENNIPILAEFRADPVGLKVDWMHVYMLGNQHLQLSEQETQAYLKFINAHLQSYSLELAAHSNRRWYLKDVEADQCLSVNPNKCIGQSLVRLLPENHQQKFWLQLFNEIQMVLYQCEMNQQRMQRNEPTVDAIWFWHESQPRGLWYSLKKWIKSYG